MHPASIYWWLHRTVARQQVTWWMSTVSGQSADSNSFGHDVPVSLTDERSHDLTTADDAQTDKPAASSVKPAPSGGNEFLSGMMNANSPHGLVPKFPSWSLLSLGKYSSYSSTSGKVSLSWEQVLVWENVDQRFLLEKEMLTITRFICNIII